MIAERIRSAGGDPAWLDLMDAPAIAACERALTICDARSTTPAREVLLRACARPPHTIRAIILGQDPYPTPGHACGLAFAVGADDVPIPRSLTTISREIAANGCGTLEPRGLLRWADAGVLLLNRWLTIDDDLRPSWQLVSGAILAGLWRTTPHPLVLLAWGRAAIAMADEIPPHAGAARLILRASHPSPLGCRRPCGAAPPFIGCGHFAAANQWLTTHGAQPLPWGLAAPVSGVAS